MALLVMVSGLVLTAWGVLGLLYRPLRRLEDEVPDAVPGAEIDDDLDKVQEEVDRLLAGARSPVADGAATAGRAGDGPGRPVDAGDGPTVRVGSRP